MSEREITVEVVGVEPADAGQPRVRLRVELPPGAASDMLRRQVGQMYARELGKLAGLKARRLPWGKGIHVDQDGDELLVTAKGLGLSEEAALGSLATEAAARVNRELGPDGEMGKRVRELFDKLGV